MVSSQRQSSPKDAKYLMIELLWYLCTSLFGTTSKYCKSSVEFNSKYLYLRYEENSLVKIQEWNGEKSKQGPGKCCPFQEAYDNINTTNQ